MDDQPRTLDIRFIEYVDDIFICAKETDIKGHDELVLHTLNALEFLIH